MVIPLHKIRKLEPFSQIFLITERFSQYIYKGKKIRKMKVTRQKVYTHTCVANKNEWNTHTHKEPKEKIQSGGKLFKFLYFCYKRKKSREKVTFFHITNFTTIHKSKCKNINF